MRSAPKPFLDRTIVAFRYSLMIVRVLIIHLGTSQTGYFSLQVLKLTVNSNQAYRVSRIIIPLRNLFTCFRKACAFLLHSVLNHTVSDR